MIDKVQSNAAARFPNATSSVDRYGRTSLEPRGVKDVSTEVQLSDEAQVLQRLMQAVNNTPDVRQDVVDQARQKIQSGEYKVDVEALAEQLVQFIK